MGSLQWLASTTRPDISYAVSQLSRFNSAWTVQHWLLAKQVLRYLKGSIDLKITYTATNASTVVYTDSDFSQCPETRRSVTGYSIHLGGGPVCWKSQRQHVVALSTTEAEFMAASDGARQMAWVKSFLFDIHSPLTSPTIIHIDNTSAIFNATSEGIKNRSKHIDRRYHYIREKVEVGDLLVKHVPTSEMLADHLTKLLTAISLSHALKINNLSSRSA